MSIPLGMACLAMCCAIWIIYRIHRVDMRHRLPPPSKDVIRGNDAGWWT